ncbi:helix-turn-helix transcriptional regulator [uncultured Treponema sp.]|uniref:helix-turn-helix domain-containing protein n=1 Tax=uncultured Treponema sp. TaxID=162155 RepID=UPI002595D67B|nr:helix-turn-helix transcriptional regulator [uncultured Treponema sp.]
MTEEELQTRVIENIRSIRKKAGLSQERLADKADISRQMMNDIEGRRRWLTKNSLVKISNALNVDVSELFIPIQDENDNIRTFYDAITKKIKEQVKIALNNALETI